MDENATVPSTEAEAATDVPRVDVEAVNRARRRELYAKHEKIYPRRAHGTFRRLKWVIMAATLGFYYLAPWIRWDRGPAMPDQAILIDFPGRRFYFFFVEIWPDEIYFVTGLLILAALVLFLVTALFGRVWCGYMCPQTVWTDLFIAVERFVEGDRNARIRFDRAPWTAGKIAKKAAKHAIWLVIAAATGGAWVFYFADAPTLAGELVRFEASTAAYVFIAILTFTTYLLGGIAREQVCIYMCPWPRIQGALQDEDSLIVSYHPGRGEPRGPHKRGEGWEGRGDCIDCNQCVVVCPMGIDIRDGAQLECIGCALCIDACNAVMDKVDRPRGLIGYDTLAGLGEDRGPRALLRHLVRPRTVLYTAAIVLVAAVMLGALLSRSQLEVSVQRDRNPLFVRLADGGVRNGYTLKVLNKHQDARRYALTVEGLTGARLRVLGLEDAGGPLVLSAPPDRLQSYRVFVTVPPAALAGASAPLTFVLGDLESDEQARYRSTFRGPAP